MYTVYSFIIKTSPQVKCQKLLLLFTSLTNLELSFQSTFCVPHICVTSANNWGCYNKEQILNMEIFGVHFGTFPKRHPVTTWTTKTYLVWRVIRLDDTFKGPISILPKPLTNKRQLWVACASLSSLESMPYPYSQILFMVCIGERLSLVLKSKKSLNN